VRATLTRGQQKKKIPLQRVQTRIHHFLQSTMVAKINIKKIMQINTRGRTLRIMARRTLKWTLKEIRKKSLKKPRQRPRKKWRR